MKPAEEIAEEIVNPDEHNFEDMKRMIIDFIHQDRLAVRKKCAERAKNYMCDCEQNDDGDDCSDLIAKAIEEVSL